MANRYGSPEVRFFARAGGHDMHECWPWRGTLHAEGYGRWTVDGVRMFVHRWAYEHFIGPIPEGHEPDHLCRNRACVNPWHLEAVPKRVNIMRGEGAAAVAARAKAARGGRCEAGHPTAGRCRVCRRQRYQRLRECGVPANRARSMV